MQEGGTEQTGLSRYGLLHGGYLVSLPQTRLDPNLSAANDKKQRQLLLSSASFGSGDFAG